MYIGYALCGSFCTFSRTLAVMERLAGEGHRLLPILSEAALTTDTRFGKAADHLCRIEDICQSKAVTTVRDAEPLGPKVKLDLMIVAPCTGNTLAKLANGITDTTVTMACKAHLRCDRPLIVALSSNDAMSGNFVNLASFMGRKSVYFVPMEQDDPVLKPHSLVAKFELIPDAVKAAMEQKQLRPLFL